MTEQNLSHLDRGALRDASDSLIGMQVVLDDLLVPADETGKAEATRLSTRDKVVAVVAKVELYPQQSGTWDTAYGDSRPRMSSFVIPQQMGNFAVSVVLDDARKAIGVLSRLVTQFGGGQVKEMPWRSFVMKKSGKPWGIAKEQRKQFMGAASGINIFDPNSALRLERVDAFDGLERKPPNESEKDHSDFDCSIELTRESVETVKRNLPMLERR